MSEHSKPPTSVSQGKRSIAQPPPNHPFANRENFPAWEDALRVGQQQQQQQQQPSSSVVDLDQSMFSQASSMNLSIGARAALNEHLRHVQKYGLDVSVTIDEESPAGAASRRLPTSLSSSPPSNPLDAAWDRIVDNSHCSASFVHNNNNSSSLLEDSTILESYVGGDGMHNESIEVMTNVSNDYFNSSRVLLLGTPERNRLLQPQGITTRGGGGGGLHQSLSLLDQDDDDDDDDDYASQESSAADSLMLRMFHQVRLSPTRDTSSSNKLSQHQQHPDTSFASFSGVDISRISAEGSDAGGGSGKPRPNCSFPADQSAIMGPSGTTGNTNTSGSGSNKNTSGSNNNHNNNMLHQSFLSHMSSPGRDFRPEAVLSPCRTPSRNDTGRRQGSNSISSNNNISVNVSGFSTPKRGGSTSHHSFSASSQHEKENAAGATTAGGEWNMIGLSPIGSRSSQKQPSSSAHIQRHQQPHLQVSASFAAVDEGTPCPVDQNDKNNITVGNTPNGILEYDRMHDSEISTLNSSSAGKGAAKNQSKESDIKQKSISNSSPDWSSLDLDDRRRYRTVVPNRVFWSGDYGDWPEQYDSFSAPAPPARKLLDSFETVDARAAHRSGYSDPT
jgi:hypothetical protein